MGVTFIGKWRGSAALCGSVLGPGRFRRRPRPSGLRRRDRSRKQIPGLLA